MALPFLYELRQLLDWSCTPTTLQLMDWMKLEVGGGWVGGKIGRAHV